MHILMYNDKKGGSSMRLSCGFSRYAMSGNSCVEGIITPRDYLYSNPYYTILTLGTPGVDQVHCLCHEPSCS